MRRSFETVQKYWDNHCKPVCGICVDALIPAPYKAGSRIACSDRPDSAFRVYYLSTKVDESVLEAYFSNPQCTAERHAWYEQKALADAREAVERANESLSDTLDAFADLLTREPGWSVEA